MKDGGDAVTEVDDELMFANIPRTASSDALEYKMEQISLRPSIHTGSERVSLSNVMQAGSSRRSSFLEITVNSSGKSPNDNKFSASSRRFKTAKHVSSAGKVFNLNGMLRQEESFVQHAVLPMTLPNQVHS
jgi:hypothetical protein